MSWPEFDVSRSIYLATILVLFAFALSQLVALAKPFTKPVSLPTRSNYQANVPKTLTLTKPIFQSYYLEQRLLANISLDGIVYASEPKKRQAIIDINGQQKRFRMGDELANSVVVASITPHQVVLERQSAMQHLRLPKAHL